MSQENVEIVQANFDVWNAKNMHAWGELLDPDAGDRVLVRFIWHGAGHGPEADLEVTGIYTVRKLKIREFEFFWDHAEALEAVGLSE